MSDGDLVAAVPSLRCESNARKMFKVPTVSKALYRGIDSRALLANSGKLLYVLDGVAEYDAFHLSTEVPQTQMLDCFISHSWRTPGWSKVLCLRCRIFLSYAWGIALLLTMSGIFLMNAGVLELRYGNVHMYAYNAASHRQMHYQTSLLWLPFALFVCFFILRQGHRLLPRRWFFLDRACISQADVEKKLAGISLLTCFLSNSRNLLIMWDHDYFSRLWCSCEVAVFVRTRGTEHVDFLPLKLPVVTLILLAYHVLTSMVILALAPVTSASEGYTRLLTKFDLEGSMFQYFLAYYASALIMYVSASLVVAAPLFWFLRGQLEDRWTILRQLGGYRLREARVTVEDDRKLVEAIVRDHFGSVEEFDCYMRNEFRTHVENLLGKQLLMPYHVVLFAGLGHTIMRSSLLDFPRDTTNHDADILCTLVLQLLCTDPMSFWLAGKFAEKVMHRGNSYIWGPVFVAFVFAGCNAAALAAALVVPIQVRIPVVVAAVLGTWWLHGLMPKLLKWAFSFMSRSDTDSNTNEDALRSASGAYEIARSASGSDLDSNPGSEVSSEEL